MRGKKAIMFSLWHFGPSKRKALKSMLGLGFKGLFWDVVHPSTFFFSQYKTFNEVPEFSEVMEGEAH